MLDIKFNRIKLKVIDTYKKGEKITTNFEHSDDSVFVNKAYLDTILSKIEDHLSLKEKGYNEFKLRKDKQSEETLFGKAVKMSIQILYEKKLFNNFDSAEEVSKDYLLIEVNERHRLDLVELNDDVVIEWLYSLI